MKRPQDRPAQWREKAKSLREMLGSGHPLTSEERAKMLEFMRANHPVTPTDNQEA